MSSSEPLRQIDPDDYPEDNETSELEGIEGGGESTPRREGHLSEVPEDSAEPGANPSGFGVVEGGGESTPRSKDHLREASSLSPDEIDSAERGKGKGYGKYGKKTGGYGSKSAVPDEEKGLIKGGLGSMVHKPAQGITGLAARMFQSKRARNGGIIGGGVVGLSIVIISTFSPILRLDHLLQNINNKAYAAAGDAVEHRMEYLFERYMVRKITGLKGCKAVVSTNCRMNYANAGLATNMYRAWSDARIEEKLFARMGLRVESTRNPDRKLGVHRFTMRDKNGQKITWATEDDFNRFMNGQYEGGRREFGRQIKKALREETRWYQVMERIQVRKMLSRKHNIKFWCYLSCEKKDAAEEKIKDSPTRWKFRFIERFVYPFSAKYGVILTCITTGDIAGGRCSDKLKQQGIERRDIPASEVDEILADLENAESRGQLRLGSVVMERMLAKIIGKTAARTTLSAVPVAGQIYLGLTILYMVDSVDQAIENNELSKIAANINSTQYIEFYTAIRSDSDAVKTGALAANDLGAHSAEFDKAEDSRVWRAYNKTPSNNSLAFLSPTAYAATDSGNDEEYKCANGKPIPSGELVCEEKKVAREYKVEEFRDNFFVDGIIDLLNPMDNCLHLSPDLDLGGIGIDVSIETPCAYTVRDAVGGLLGAVDFAIDTVFGPAAEAAIAILKNVPGTKQLLELVQEKFEQLALAVVEKVWPLPLQADSLGREKVDGLYAGADLSANDFTKGGYTDDGDSYGQGAPKLKKEDLAAIYQEQLEQQEYEFKNSSLFNRVANINEPGSLVNKVAFSMPTGLSNAFFSLLSVPSNFFKSLINIPGALFSSSVSAESLAQQQASINAFGVTRYGYSPNDPALRASPSKYTPEYCEASAEARKDSMSENKTTGFDEYSKADPCLLENVTVQSGCALYTPGNNCGEGGSATTGTTECGDSRTMARAILNHDRISGIEGDSDVQADLENTAAGRPAYNDVELNPDMLCFILQAAEEEDFVINDLTGHGASHSVGSNHYDGNAVDVGCSGIGVMEDKLDEIAADNDGVNNGERCSNTHHAHYDFLE